MARPARRSRRSWAVLLAAIVAPVAVAAAWIPVRTAQPNVVVALALVVLITATGVWQSRAPVIAAAVSAALAFVFFDTEPYDQFRIARQPDLEIAVALVIVGVLTGELALRVARQRQADQGAAGDLSRIREASARLAFGEELVTMIGAVAAQVQQVLGGAECTYTVEALPAGTPVVTRDGRIDQPVPDALALPVWGLGTVVGHFVVRLRSPQALRREALAVAVTLADQVGAALAAQAGVPRQAAWVPAEPVPPLRLLR